MPTGGIGGFVNCAPVFVPLFLWLFPLLSQMELQDDGVMLGLDSSLGKDIVGIINNVFQAPWGGSHTCQKDEKALECSLCQSSILCYQLGCELLERLTPREEIHLVVRHASWISMHQINKWTLCFKQIKLWNKYHTVICPQCQKHHQCSKVG